MPQQIRRRRQGSINVTSFGNKFVQPLGRGMIYRELALRWVGALTFGAAANNAAANFVRGDEWGCIARIDVIANGTDVIRSFTGSQLAMINRLVYGNHGRTAPQIGDGATAAPAFDSTLILPFWQFLAVKPMDTALDSSKLSDLRLEITMEPAANITTTPPTAINANLHIVSMESFGIEGVFSDCKIYPLQQVVGGANANVQVQLPVTALYRGFFINCAAGAGQNSSDQDSINNVQLVSGTTIFADVPWAVLRDWQRQRTNLPDREQIQNVAATAPITGGFLNNFKSARMIEDAWTFLDLVPDGYLSEGVDSVGFSELFLNFDVAAACTLTVLPTQVFPVRGAQRAA